MHKSSSENPSLSPPLLLPLHRHVERIARAWPHKAAIQTYDGVFWSYSQLHRISVGLGARIARQLALAPGSLVPVALEKRASSVALILALFWLRCAYVPCDPSQPQARLHRILDQLNSHLLLANGTIDSSVSRKVEVINVEAWVRELEGQGSLECVSLSSDDGVPFLFTSGSTGTPKGVKVSHRSVAASIAAQQALYGTRQQQECGNAFGAPLWTHRCLQFSQFSFDWSVWDLTMLASGACLCLRDLTDMLPEMGDTLSCLRVTLLQTTPTVAKLFTPSEARHLDLLCLSGEPLVDDVRNVWAPHVRLINAYGITEITVVCCAQDRFTVDMPASLIGNALGTSRLLVLDDNNEPCALDCPGELLVCGDQIAEGYFRDPERTAAAFVRLRDGAKAYRSGDLVVFDSALNALRYLRRKDCQVNIKGLRIELGEVQVGLTRSASAQMPICAVDVEAMGNELVAFVVFEPSFSRSEEPNKIKKTGPATTQEIEIDTSSSRQALQELAVQARTELPRYMVPTVWIALAELPLVSSGKLDKRKLDQVYQRHLETWCTAQTQRKSTPDDDNHKNKEGPRSAKGPMMTSVLEAWSHVLGRDRKSISSNVEFGFLGGDSILAIRLSSHLRRLGIGLS
ncbi:acetyl-CoA synthetase-like protein, partial [Tilletiaria anomala UBC 951]